MPSPELEIVAYDYAYSAHQTTAATGGDFWGNLYAELGEEEDARKIVKLIQAHNLKDRAMRDFNAGQTVDQTGD